MRKWIIGAALLVLPTVAFALTATQIHVLDKQAGAGAFKVQLGTLLNSIDARVVAVEATNVGNALASGKIIVGNGSNLSAAVNMSGDATIANTGAVTIGAGKILNTMLAVPGVDGLDTKRIAKSTYDFAVQGGTAAPHGLGVTLPSKAVILRSWFYVVTQLAGTSGATIALSCETANNIFAAADETGVSAAAFVEGISDGTATNFKKITSACEITATIAVHPLTAGKLNVFTEYVVHD